MNHMEAEPRLCPALANPAQSRRWRAEAHTVLYIEDNPINLRLVEEIITLQSDMRLLGAVTGAQGIAVARASLPDAILLDINLPDMHGLKVLEILGSAPETAHIPVIALTSNAMPEDIRRAMQAGMFRYITKPINFDELLDAIGAAVRHSRSKPPAPAAFVRPAGLVAGASAWPSPLVVRPALVSR